MDKLTQNLVMDTLISRYSNPQDIIDTLAEVNKFDYLDWEGLIEEKEVENRVYRNFRPCNQCKVVSNRLGWINIQRLSGGIDRMCSDCAAPLRKEHIHNCAWCNASYVSLKPIQPDTDVCGIHDHHLELVRKHLRRAELLNLPATLTVKQWGITIKHFNNSCAYCGNTPYENILEHYIPLSLRGGTTQDNCVPSCQRCNTRKYDKHPNDFKHLFPSQNIARIQSYFETITMEVSHS